MEKQMNITQVREELGEVVDEVQYRNSKYIILRHGKPAVAVVPLHVYENWKSNRERLFKIIEQMRASSDAGDPEEVMALVLEAQQAVRAETSKK
jgi:prevent-host-death family protein